jgi:adenylate kinase
MLQIDSSSPARATTSLLTTLGALALLTATVHAASEKVKSACKDDYFRHCSAHAVGSDSLRQCMRAVGENLSTGCLVALVEDGEITKQDIERHKAKQAEAKAEKPATEPKPAASAAASTGGTAKSSPAKTVDTPKVASIGKTALPVADAKQKNPRPDNAPVMPAVKAVKAEAAGAKPPTSSAKVASIGKPAALPPPAAEKSKTVAKLPSAAQAMAKTAAAPGTKAVAPQVASKAASTGKVAAMKAADKPIAKAVAMTSPQASKPAAQQPGRASLSGEGAHLASAAGQRFTHNVCHAKTIAGDPISQTCALDEKCCLSGLAGKLRCVPQNASCNGF